MAYDLAVDPANGALTLAGWATIGAGQPRSALEPALRPLIKGELDHRNGYVWLTIGGLAFGGLPCTLGLCFNGGAVSEAGWNLEMPDAVLEHGWPTRETSDREVAFCRQVLAGQIGREVPEEGLAFAWAASGAPTTTRAERPARAFATAPSETRPRRGARGVAADGRSSRDQPPPR